MQSFTPSIQTQSCLSLSSKIDSVPYFRLNQNCLMHQIITAQATFQYEFHSIKFHSIFTNKAKNCALLTFIHVNSK